MTLNAKVRGFIDFWRFRAATSLYHSQGWTTELLLCDPDREFGICILATGLFVRWTIHTI